MSVRVNDSSRAFSPFWVTVAGLTFNLSRDQSFLNVLGGKI